ncbi:hypothetical protein CRENBAI_011016 [Crenichthys baileyi]|uniref:Adhesion G-protein coupled receptor G2 n=1 Tax=Crenichthys baileyi TaxID=28760 RepID=A0AAV9QTT1_9TELE
MFRNGEQTWISADIACNFHLNLRFRLVSKAFDCNSTRGKTAHGVAGFIDFCEASGQLQVVEVSCKAKIAATESQTACNVLLFLSHAISACDLQRVGEAALQYDGRSVQANITGNIERVGRNLCEHRLPSSGDFVRCTSTSSLDEICQSNRTTKVTCTVFETNSEAAPQETTKSCNGKVPRFCNCSAFCETKSQLYAIKINITSDNVTITHLRSLLLRPNALSVCNPDSWCDDYSDIITKYRGAHLECYGEKNPQRLYSCMVVLEMSGPVKGCSLSKLVQLIIENEKLITSDGSLSRMMVCGGAPDLSSLLAANLSWNKADLLSSDVCQPDPILLKCEANETIAVLLADSCPPDPQTTSTTQPTTRSNSLTVSSSVINSFASAAKNKNTSAINKEELANELLKQTQDVSKLNFSQVSNVVGNMEKFLEEPSVSQSVGQNIINIISNLMNADPEVLSGSSNRLIQLVDNLGLKLEVTGDNGILSSTSLVLAVRKVNGTNFPETSVEIFNTDNIQLRGVNRSQVKRSAPALGSVDLPSSLTAGLSPEEKQEINRVQFTFYIHNSFFKDSSVGHQTAVSAVLGSSVANLSICNLKENITFTIMHMNLSQENITSCVFWNFTKNKNVGGWDETGCSVVIATPEYTTCSCNHLTSFAILLDLSREGITDPQQATILTFITYIGCGISAVFLAFTLITYLLFEKLLRDIPAKILVQLCFSLTLLNLVFLLNGWLSTFKLENVCISTAFFLHYFLLSSFTWAGLEALHMYLSIVQVFTPYLSRYMLKFSLMGWGIPLIVVVITISVDKDNYGLVQFGKREDGTTDDFCWLRNNIAYYVGVVAYFVVVFLFCLVVFIAVMVQLSRIKKQNPHNQSPNRSTMTDMRSIVGLVLLLGLTWGFALFTWGAIRLPSLYLFTIFNSLLGLFVFVFHCAVKENVRRMWRTYLCCGNMRLPENLEWSRTATQNNKILSVVTATTSAHQQSNHSSSIASNLTYSSSSVFLDSGIVDCSNSDVVLHEFHRRSLSLQGEP